MQIVCEQFSEVDAAIASELVTAACADTELAVVRPYVREAYSDEAAAATTIRSLAHGAIRSGLIWLDDTAVGMWMRTPPLDVHTDTNPVSRRQPFRGEVLDYWGYELSPRQHRDVVRCLATDAQSLQVLSIVSEREATLAPGIAMVMDQASRPGKIHVPRYEATDYGFSTHPEPLAVFQALRRHVMLQSEA